MEIEKTLAEFDRLDKKKFDEHDVGSQLRSLQPEGSDDLSFELLSEAMAFGFADDYPNKNSGWGLYFGPMAVWNNNDGTVTESPSIKQVTPEMIQYWEKRGRESVNPILKSRYLGLVWEFQSKISASKPSHEICKSYIKALLDRVNEEYCKHEVYGFRRLKRALVLSLELNDDDLVNKCKEAILIAENKYSQDNKPGLWGYSFDLLIGNRKVKLSPDEEVSIINELESKLVRLTSDEGNQKIDPWGAEAAGARLATYYRRLKKEDDVKRVILKIGDAFQKIENEGSAMQRSGWLEHLHRLYSKFNLKNEADDVLLRLREIGPKVAAELKPISHSFSLPKEDTEKYLKEIVSGTIEEVLTRVSVIYIPNKEKAKEQIFDLSKKAPLMYLMSHQLQDEKGRLIATIGSLEEDLEGHIVRHISQNLSFASIFLRLIFQEAKNKLGLCKKEIIGFMKQSAIIQPDRIPIIETGLDAYFNDNYLVSIHLIIPQIEEAIRNLVEFSGGNVLKPSRRGGYQLRTFDDILRDKLVVNILGEDFANYFRILFTDQRGWNMRNNVCHGIAAPGSFTSETADRLIHALLCLGLVKDNESKQ